MSGFDKDIIARKLKEKGWVEHEDETLSPPDSLWKNKPNRFYLGDAEEIQLYLEPSKEKE